MVKRRKRGMCLICARMLSMVLLTGLLSGCALQNGADGSRGEVSGSLNSASSGVSEESQESTSEGTGGMPKSTSEAAGGSSEEAKDAFVRPLLLKEAPGEDGIMPVPCVEAYTVERDLGNIDNLWQFYLAEEEAEKLCRNGFVVSGGAGSEFFEIYEKNRYQQIPSFVTVDSLMHTYHLYFGYLLNNIEKEYLADGIRRLSKRMLDDSILQLERLRGSEWENAAKRNVAFFTVGAVLLDETVAVNEDAADIVRYELESINGAAGIAPSKITGQYEDYSQYIPRGYYEGDEVLERYFKAMMWYGRMPFLQSDEDMDRSALLMTLALKEDTEAYKLWEAIYAVTSFFAGASDDLGMCEYEPAFREAYGDGAGVEDLAGDSEAFDFFRFLTAELPVPRINSIPIDDEDDNIIKSFRFMGQRFTVDAFVMQKLIYQDVRENREGLRRMLPDVLDVPAALGSDMALEILEENGAADYEGYSQNMKQMREILAEQNDTLWSASLYAGWLNTLRPLLTVKGEGYPMFMQNREWTKKNLECFAGSFTELKHDTILYAKQVFAEMGGGYDEEPDSRGYVEPEPLVYARFMRLADSTAQGLKEYHMLSSADEENLKILSQMAQQLLTISQKELQDQLLTEDEYEFIRAYGGNIEHFWYEAVKSRSDSEWIDSAEFPAAIVADIATDPNGQVLEAATGNPSMLLVAIKVDGKVKIASGSVYSFYQFAWPLSDRLTDIKWRQMMGLEADEDGNYNFEEPVDKPEWTESYRYRYE